MNEYKEKAVFILNHLFNVPDGFVNGSIEKLVDVLIEAAIQEVAKNMLENPRG
jgi:hypothetical protein